MFEYKKGYTSGSIVRVLSSEESKAHLASPHIVERLDKYAQIVRTIAPKSNDFLYFSIIFLKAAESTLIDQHGNTKKIGSENAWGFFDDQWRWHGNVPMHRNNNLDIFPESELRIASRKWIGKPLCVDHQSDSVDGVRGIILDTHYDQKLKQVVGLCALDRVNYPDLARKVESGTVRFGSMGTGVKISVCSEFTCANQAKTASEYCNCIKSRTAWGEINVGLEPIEYSLVVQPAEPGAILLRCIASIQEKKAELEAYGVDGVDDLISKLSFEEADKLDRLVSNVCGENGCSIQQRKAIVTAFFNNKNFIKNSSLTSEQQTQVAFAEALAELKSSTGKSPEEAPELYEPVFNAFGRSLRQASLGEQFTVEDATVGDIDAPSTIMSPKDSEGTPDYTSSGGDASLMSGETEPSDSFGETGGVGPESYAYASKESNNLTISQIKEDIMNESRLRKRAEMRRRLAYHQGGADGVEPSGTYKDEGAEQNRIREKDDKHMNLNPANLGGTDGMAPGDEAVKEKQKRAKVQNRMQTRLAYHQGGADGVEPNTYKSEDYGKYWDADKQMHLNPANLGGTDGMAPGDEAVKEKQKRAAYNGPALKTRLTQRRNLDGSINKSASKFEVFAGDELIIATTASTIYGPSLEENWGFLTSPDYGKRVVAEIRAKGLNYVGNLLTKSAQEAAPALGLPEEAAAPAEPALPEEPLGEEPLLDEPALDEELEGDPRAVVEEAFIAIEDALEEARTALDRLGGSDIDVNVNVGEGTVEEEPEQLALSSYILNGLKTAIANADYSADELAMISDTFKNYRNLTAKQRAEFNSMTRDAISDSAEIIGETRALLSMANVMVNNMSKVAEYTEAPAEEAPAAVAEEEVVNEAADQVAEEEVSSPEEDHLIAEAMEFRRMRREAIAKKALELRRQKKEAVMSAGEALARGLSNRADDCEEAAEEEVAEHEENMHSDADDAPQSVVASKMQESFAAKRAASDNEKYKVKLRRAYDVGMEMQEKGLLARTKTALDRQVDEILSFDDPAFESFKRSIGNAKAVTMEKNASYAGSLNVGITDEGMSETPRDLKARLASMW